LTIDGLECHEAKERITSIVLVTSRIKRERDADDEEEEVKEQRRCGKSGGKKITERTPEPRYASAASFRRARQ
jgi:hypothetical protein